MNDPTTTTERPQPSTRPPLRRPQEGRWLAGVARGLSDTWAVPAWVVRAVLLIFIPVGGLGLLFYGIGWAFIPAEGDPEPLASRWVDQLRDRQAWLGAALVTVAGIIVLSSPNIVDNALIWAGALLVIGFLLYRGDLDGLSQPSGPVPDEDTSGSVAVDVPEAAPVEYQPRAFFADGDPAPPTRPEGRPPRAPSYLGRLTLGALLLTVGAMVALDVGGLIEPTTRHYFAAPLLIVGVGLVVGAFVGRSRGLIVLGLLLTPFALAGALLDISFDGEFGSIDSAPRSVDDLRASYQLEGGDIRLDLRRLQLDGEDVTIHARVGGGEIYVMLPSGYQVEIDGSARLGQIDVLGNRSNGFDVSRVDTRPGEGGTIRLDLDAGIGKVVVPGDEVFFGTASDYGGTLGIRPLTVEELQFPFVLDVGTFEMDLRDLDLPDADFPVELNATVERGNIVVLLPPTFNVNVVASTGVGAIELMGFRTTGVDLVDELSIEGSGDAQVDLILNVGEGSIVVVRP